MSGEASYLELGVADVAAATAFYGAVLGWSADTMPGGARVALSPIGVGIHGDDPQAGFEVFFAVNDLDAAIERVQQAGGHTTGEVSDAPGFGRYVECVDDQGTRFGLRHPA